MRERQDALRHDTTRYDTTGAFSRCLVMSRDVAHCGRFAGKKFSALVIFQSPENLETRGTRGTTVLRAETRDQPALRGALLRLRSRLYRVWTGAWTGDAMTGSRPGNKGTRRAPNGGTCRNLAQRAVANSALLWFPSTMSAPLSQAGRHQHQV
ncbi:hypothetical protein VTK56DRAFT_1390 [Thermocarpiscus australiensis]